MAADRVAYELLAEEVRPYYTDLARHLDERAAVIHLPATSAYPALLDVLAHLTAEREDATDLLVREAAGADLVLGIRLADRIRERAPGA